MFPLFSFHNKAPFRKLLVFPRGQNSSLQFEKTQKKLATIQDNLRGTQDNLRQLERNSRQFENT